MGELGISPALRKIASTPPNSAFGPLDNGGV
jgi:hypothetical protein